MKWDALIIGAGHNGLAAAAYLAKSGLSVAVLERRHIIGGAAVTEEIIPGFRFSRCSYLQSLLRPSVIRELELKRHGLRLLKPIASIFTPCIDGRYLLLWPDNDRCFEEISKFSKRDAHAYQRYEYQLQKFSKIMDFLLDSVPPETIKEMSSFSDWLKDKFNKSRVWARLLKHTLSLGQNDMVEFMDLVLSPTSKVLNNWFETDVLKGTLACDATIGSMARIDTPGSGYVLPHHVMGQTDGDRNVWSHVEGGMGSVSLALSKAAQEAGACILTNTEVSRVTVHDNGTVNGVLLADGQHIHSTFVLSNATPYKTFTGSTKINLAVDSLPNFRCLRSVSSETGPHHTSTIHFSIESMDKIISACQDAWNGLPSKRPVIEMTIPSSMDNTISPPGKHVISLFTQYTPYSPSDGTWKDPSYREAYARKCFSLIDEYAPGFSSSIIGYDMLTPPDLEREFSLTGGSIFHGALSLDQLFLMRPIKGWSGYRTPVKGLYLCGSGAHPGGGVTGAPGRNAALLVLRDMKKLRR
ncbi:hypothetical protein RND81_11G210600 [Saponaria officinalis]|uniref:Amine oxidase domain-containing protein n=1 Tax=Saponaria officinalis TaxID=3572 RepID=A0AAW1HQW3_SAPOF